MAAIQTEEGTQTTRHAGDTGDTRALILRTAETLFMEHGYAAVSMNQIVEEISKTRKLSKPAIYYHFVDKEALFTAVLDQMIERRGNVIAAAAMVEGDFRARVIALAAALATGREYFNVVRTAISELGPTFRERFRHGMHAEMDKQVSEIFERAAERGELRPGISSGVAVSTLIGIVMHLSFREAMDGAGRDIPALAADILLNGIAARPEKEDADIHDDAQTNIA